ncbi:hypothetical protein K2F43_08455 [Clostridium estertheticum]|uniref:hypothetical protein n=1 Tax=Clostridium estertheticum TaxID=238834 RepID=UPI001C6F4E92|nr:hypothetical protein [Clostridium estertheticum]MBW9171235.1 hypothetical protein [Clostridium estertheticum]WLC73909.1 hypothetical protein KTC99_14085 [Clostridium estertheticum]
MIINKRRYTKLNIQCIITILISLVIGFLNPYEYYMSTIYNFWYAFSMFIYFILIKIARKFLENTGSNVGVKNYFNWCIDVFESKKIKIFMIGALCFFKIICFIIQYTMYSGKVKSEINFLQNTFLLNNALLMFILSTIAEIFVVIIFSKRIWKENGQRDETV